MRKSSGHPYDCFPQVQTIYLFVSHTCTCYILVKEVASFQLAWSINGHGMQA